MKGELEDIGEEVDGNVESISKMQTQVLNLTGGKVNIFNDDGSFKSTYEIMDGIAEIYDKLSSTDQASLLETIAGKNRANDVAALISNWEQVEKAMESAMGAEGSAAAENEKYMESIQGRLDSLTASWQALSNTFMKSDFLKVLITGLTKILDLLNGIVKTFGSFGTIGVGFAIFQLFKTNGGFSYLKIMNSLLKESGYSFANFGTAAKMAGSDLKAFMTTPAGIATGIGLITAAIGLAVQAYKNWEAEQARLRQETIDTNNETLSSIDTFEQVYVKYAGKTNLTSGEEDELKTAINDTVKALGNKANALKGVIDKNSDYVKSLESVSKEEIAAAQRTAKESLKAAEDSLKNDSWTLWSGSKITIDLSGRGAIDEFVKARDVATELMGGYIDNLVTTINTGDFSYQNAQLEPINWDADHEDMDAVVDYYYKLIELNDTLVQKSIDENDDSWINNDIYENAKKTIDNLSNSVKEYLTQQYNSAKYNYELQNGIPKTAEEYYAMRDSILSNIEASQGYKDAIGDIADAEWGEIFDLQSYNDSANKINEITQKFTESNHIKNTPWSTAQTELETFNEWVNTLSPEDLKIVYDIALNTDTANYNLDEWKSALENYKVPKEYKISFSELIADTDGDDDFIDKVNSYTEKVETLQEAFKSFKSGEFSESDFIELVKIFPELADNADNLDVAIADLLGTMNTDITSEFSKQFGKMDTDEDVTALKNFQDAVLELGKSVGSTAISIDISTETDGMKNLFTAMKESVSSTGLTAKSIKTLKARYQELEDYDAARLFERTSNGVHLNTKALRELESAYEKQKKQKINDDLQSLIDQYNDLTVEIEDTSDAAAKAELYAQRADIQDQINDTADLAAQYEGLTSAFYKWEQAQSIGEEGDMYDGLADGLEDIKELYQDGLIGTNKFRTAVQLMSNEDLSTASIDELLAAYEAGYSKMTRYFTDSSDGCLNFLNDVQKLNSEWVHMNEDGSWEINFGVGDDQKVADALGINVESVQSIMRKLSDYGFDINLDSMYTSLEFLETSAEKANEKLIALGKTKVKFNFDTSDVDTVNTQIAEAQKLLNTFKNSDGTVNLSTEGAEEAQEILVTLISKKQLLNAPSVLSVNTTNAEDNIAKAVGLLKDFQTNYNNMEIETAIGADTTTVQTDIQTVLTKLNEIPTDVRAKLGLDNTDFVTAVDSLKSTKVDVKAGVNLDQEALNIVTSTISSITPEMMVKAGLDSSLIEGYEPNDKESTVKYNVDDSDVVKYQAPNKFGKVTYIAELNSWTAPTKYGTVIYKEKVAEVNGTAHVRGTAFKNGDWRTKDSGTALGGELGQELIVRDGRYFTIGDNGAEFFKYQKDDIIKLVSVYSDIYDKILSNCWKALKLFKLKHKDEIRLSVNVMKVEKIK